MTRPREGMSIERLGVLTTLATLAALATLAPFTSARGQDGARLELSLVGGAAHTSRAGRLESERWLEPVAGVRADARLWNLAGGRAGLSLQADLLRFGQQGQVAPPCVGICSAFPPADASLVDYRVDGRDDRVALGVTWQRAATSWLHADVGAFAGVRRASARVTYDDSRYWSPSPRRPLVGGEIGASARRGRVVAGAGFQLASSVIEGGVRRSQNRVVLRAGWAMR